MSFSLAFLSTLWMLSYRAGSAPPCADDGPNTQWDKYHYRLKGKVRLLLFWVGKDNVGAGTIAFAKPHETEGKEIEGIEVIFGSNPDRIPGRINRWGYGREWAYWRERSGDRILERCFFEGFMSRSHERSLAEIRSIQKSLLYGV